MVVSHCVSRFVCFSRPSYWIHVVHINSDSDRNNNALSEKRRESLVGLDIEWMMMIGTGQYEDSGDMLSPYVLYLIIGLCFCAE